MAKVDFEITGNTVLLVTDSGLKEIDREEAISMADEDGLNLVEVNKNKDGLSVCKILDFHKEKFEAEKAKKQNKTKQVDTKEIKLTPKTALNDMRTKAKSVERILGDGDRVKISILHKGRENKFIANSIPKMEQFLELITCEYNKKDSIKILGNSVTITLTQ